MIWNAAGGGTFLWSTPGGEIAAYLENGSWVDVLESWQSAGGVPFGAVRAGDLSGWVDMRAAHRLPWPSAPVLHVRPEAGTTLYSEPGGEPLRWLPPGTPLLLQSPAEGGWLAVALLVGGQAGWLPTTALGD